MSRETLSTLATVIIAVVALGAFLRGEINGVRADVSELRKEIGDVRTELAEIRTDIVEIRADITDIRADMADMLTDISELRERMVRVEVVLGISQVDTGQEWDPG